MILGKKRQVNLARGGGGAWDGRTGVWVFWGGRTEGDHVCGVE